MRRIAVVFLYLLVVTRSYANHPGENIDQFMEGQEKYFQAIDLQDAPAFTLVDQTGDRASLSDFKDKVVILNFVFTNCQDVCPLHTNLIADIQEKINATPMKEDVQFISITTDPQNDTSDVMRRYGQSHNLDSANWTFLTVPEGAPESMTRELAEAYGARFDPVADGQQMHGVVTHVIDREGRWAAKFHGLEFGRVNMVLYVNGLISNWYHVNDSDQQTIWDKFLDLLPFKK